MNAKRLAIGTFIATVVLVIVAVTKFGEGA